MKEELEKYLALASRKRRIAAFIIDHFVMTFLILAVVFLVMGPNFVDNGSAARIALSLCVVMPLGFFLYIAKDSVKGISVGKWIMGIRVADDTNFDQTPSFGRLFKRNLFIFIWPVEFIVLASSNQKKRLGDKQAQTAVVKNINKPGKFLRILALLAVVVLFFTFIFIFAGTAMKSSDAYKVAVSYIEQQEDIINEIGGIKGYGMMPSGSINVSNGYGEAQLGITVIGNEKDVSITIYLTKEPGSEWSIIDVN
nr:RDD family protein [uncultured Carboxylicivirga sp.]